MNGESSIIDVRDAHVTFRTGSSATRALDGVSLHIDAGEIVGLVGESGSGKTTLSRAILGVEPLQKGDALYKGESVYSMNKSRLLRYRKEVQVVFQDPYGSLNPRYTIARTLGEVCRVHAVCPKDQVSGQVEKLLDAVGLSPVIGRRYPHELSGGQRQRVGIARAMAVEPDVIIADEPVSALDVSVQVQLLQLILRLRDEKGLAFLFIAHDLAVVNHICDRVYVMQQGRVVEEGPVPGIFDHPTHPYTKNLLHVVPDIEKALEKRGKCAQERGA